VGSNGKNIKPQAIKVLVKFLKIGISVFSYSTLESSAHNFVFGPQVRTKIIHCGPWPKKVVHLWDRERVKRPPICGNSVAPLWLLSVVSHCSLLYYSGVACPSTRTVIWQRCAFSAPGPTAWNGQPVALRLTPVGHSALFLSGLMLRPNCLTEVELVALLSRS